jgi:hypothetical protein
VDLVPSLRVWWAFSKPKPNPKPKPEESDMKISETFRSKFLKASDLQGRTVEAEIDLVTEEEVGEAREKKLIVYFRGKHRGIVLNQTNAVALQSSFGDETDSWAGKSVQIFVEPVMFQGKRVDGLRLRAPAAAAAPSPAPEGLDDDIPF